MNGTPAPGDLPLPTAQDGWSTYRRLLRYTLRYWYALLAGMVGFGIFAGMEAAGAKVLGYVTEVLSERPVPPEAQWILPLGMVGIFVLRGIGSFLGDYGVSYAARSIVHALRCEMFERLLTLPVRFFSSQSTGHLVTKLTYDVEQVTAAATEAIKVIFKEGLTVIALLGLLFWQNWKLTLIILTVGPVVGLLVRSASRRFRLLSQRLQGSVGEVTHVASEAVNGAQVVKVFGGQDYERRRFGDVSHYNMRQSLKMVITKAINTPAVQIVLSFPLGLIVWLALQPDIMGEMSSGDFITYLGALGLLVKPTRTLTDVNEKIQRGVAASQSIFQLIDAPAEPAGGSHDPGRVRGEVEFRDVRFAYGPDTPEVLRGVDFRIAAGQTIALVGRSGGGKSTLVSLIPRFFETTAGTVLIDGVPVADYSLEALRRQISVVYQRVVLFDDTVQANIAYGELAGADEAAVRRAADAANALEFIERLPQGFATRVGHDGQKLSGGQRQRIAIARALLKDAPILILDEATSALDTESEQRIQNALETLMKGRTTFVIAHRLSTIERADRILVIDEGRVVEQGTHAELLARNGHYARLHSRQFSDDAGEA
jgi:subfamily B ATP-binding cassette protein MsbA